MAEPEPTSAATLRPSGSIPRILPAFDPARWKFRGVLRGINRFAYAHGGWQLLLIRYGGWSFPVSGLGEVDGVISDSSPASARLVRGMNAPIVKISAAPRDKHVHLVTHDFAEAGRQGCRLLRGRGLTKLAVFTTGEAFRMDAAECVRGFTEQARSEDLNPAEFIIGPRTLARKKWVLDDQIADLADWLRTLGRPLGLMCVDDEHAWRAIEAARLAGLRVPDDVAVLGVGNDECLCDSSYPAISSIALDYEKVGFLAAQTLHGLMTGQANPEATVIPPSGVLERASTDLLAVEDELVADAIRLIHDSADPIRDIDLLAEKMHTSRRTLHRRFLAAVGRPPGDEIRRHRISSARQLIIHTDMKLAFIADSCGFPSISSLSRDIEKEYGLRPSELRRRHSAHITSFSSDSVDENDNPPPAADQSG